MRHPIISLCILVGLCSAAAAAYTGMVDNHPLQVFIAAIGVVFMSYAFVDVNMRGIPE